MELSGKVVAQKIEAELMKEVDELRSRGIKPTLAVILIGEDPASLTYVRVKESKAEELGIGFRLFHFSGACLESQVIELINELNADKNTNGIIIQLPLPNGFDTEKIVNTIDQTKDVDGLISNDSVTADAILELLEFYQIELKGKIVLVGQGRLVGRPLKKVLEDKGLRPVVCDSKTEDLKSVLRDADIIVSATGEPGLIKPEMVSSKAIVVDAGSAESSGKVLGDIDKAVYKQVHAYSPVPGGIGPVTVMMLMKKVVLAAKAL